jgi:DNA-binding NarL/FixJ family response regulator
VGAAAFVDENEEVDEFLVAIRSAATHGIVIAGRRRRRSARSLKGSKAGAASVCRLTRREREILTVAAEGLTAREIAARLGVRERTVTTHPAARSGLVSINSGDRL